jgi:tetratricopeptide (TPR) repeat protein
VLNQQRKGNDMSKITLAVLMVMTLVVFSGCRGKGDRSDQQATETAAVVSMDTVEMELSAIQEKEGSEGVIERLTEMLGDERYAALKQELAMRLMDEYSSTGNVAAMQDAWLKLALSDEGIASMIFSRVFSATATTNTADMIDWCNRIIAAPVSDTIKAQTWRVIVVEESRAGNLADIIKRLPEIMKLGQNESRAVLGILVRESINAKQYAIIDEINDFVNAKAADRSDLKPLLLSAKSTALIRQSKLDDAWAFIQSNADTLGDTGLSRAITQLLSSANREKNVALVNKVADYVFERGDNIPRTRDTVAATLITQAVDAHDSGLFLKRAQRSIDAGCSLTRIAVDFREGFYLIMNSGSDAQRTECFALVDKILKMDNLDEYTSQSFTLMALDGAFYRTDFRTAYEIIKKGVPGYDEKWHAEMLDKVGAHLALQEKRYDDAIRLFRKHMARVEQWKDPMINPENGAKMTREAVLAFNEKRLGDIYLKMGGHEKEAKEAFAKARSLYNQAISNAAPGSIERKLAQEELSQVP